MIITDFAVGRELDDGNTVLGTVPELEDSKIVFNGKNNVLFCETGVRLAKSSIIFNGNDSIVYLCSNKNAYYLALTVNNNSVFYMGRNNYINGLINVTLSEQKHCLIGNDGLFSFGIWMRTADPHLIYSTQNDQRINLSRSIFIGDHVWIGQDAFLLKGTRIDSGSIIGAMSLVAGKQIPHNESWGGNPCKRIKENVFWDGSCVHRWDDKQTELSMNYVNFAEKMKKKPDAWKYEYREAESISFDSIDQLFSDKSIEEKLQFMDELTAKKTKNRFVHKTVNSPRKWFGIH